MKNNDSLIGLIIIAFSVTGFIYTHATDMQSLVGLSPGAFPQFLFAMMAVCGIIIFIEGRQPSESTRINLNWKKFLIVVLLLVIYAYALEYIGFIISTIAFLAVALYLFEEKRIKILISVPLLTSFLIYYTFTELFLIPLP